jgi:protoporphyrinogen oxidase
MPKPRPLPPPPVLRAPLPPLAPLGQALIALKAWDEAEPLLCECLAIREKAKPDDWMTFNTRSMLGGALLAQNKLAEAEPLLLDGYKGMKDREVAIPPQGKVRIAEALDRLVQLYVANGDAAEAAAWRSKLEAAQAEAKTIEPPATAPATTQP